MATSCIVARAATQSVVLFLFYQQWRAQTSALCAFSSFSAAKKGSVADAALLYSTFAVLYFLPTIIADLPSIIMPARRFEPKIVSVVSI